jgi:hypothetical protein
MALDLAAKRLAEQLEVVLYCSSYCYMVQELPEHPVGSQRGSWGTSVIVCI